MQRQPMTEEWLSLDGSSARLFRLHEEVREGQPLGQAWGSDHVTRAPFDGRVVGIQYDMWRDAVIVVVAQDEGKRAHTDSSRVRPRARAPRVRAFAVA